MVTGAAPFLTRDWLLVLAGMLETRFPVSLIACGRPEAREQAGLQGPREYLSEELGGTVLAMSSLEITAPDVT